MLEVGVIQRVDGVDYSPSLKAGRPGHQGQEHIGTPPQQSGGERANPTFLGSSTSWVVPVTLG